MSVFTNSAASAPGQAAEYVTAVLGLLGDRDPLVVLAETPGALGRALEPLTTAQALAPEAAGKWSVRDVLQHLADSELVWGVRVRMVLAHDRPELAGYDQDRWAARLHYERREPRQALTQFTALRRANLALLTDASEADLQRVGVHVERGEETLAHMIRLYAGHDVMHLNQISRITRATSGR